MRIGYVVIAIIVAAGCAKGGGDDGSTIDGSCGDQCDADGDSVSDPMDMCANTPSGETVNGVGCADSQLTPKLEPTFPPYMLVWTSGGDIGRVGGLTWTYEGIQRGDLFHIYWILCDDPLKPCGVSLDGPIDRPSESWRFSAPDSDASAGKLVFTNMTAIALESAPALGLEGRLTVTVVDPTDVPLPFATVGALGVTARAGGFGVEIPGTGYKVAALIEVKDSASAWTPYLDYYDAAPTPMMGGSTSVSFGASFYSK